MFGSCDGPASIYRKACPRDVLRSSTAEKDDEPADGLHPDEPARRLTRREVILRGALYALARLCGDRCDLALDGSCRKRAGCHRIAGNTGARGFQRNTARETKDCRLGGDVIDAILDRP